MNNEEFQIQIGASIDLSRPQRALEEFVQKSSRITKAINLDDGSRQFDKLTKYVNQTGQSFVQLTRYIEDADGYLDVARNEIVSVSTNFDKLNASLKDTTKQTEIFKTESGGLQTVITEVNAQGEKIITTITETKDAFGNAVKSTKVYNDTLKDTISIHTDSIINHTKEAKAIDGVGKSLQGTSKSTETFITEFGNLKTITTEVNEKGESLVTTVLKFRDALGNLVTTTKVENETLGQTIKAHTETENVLNREADIFARLNKEVQNTSREVNTYTMYNGNLKTVITEVNAQGETILTRIVKAKTGIGELTTTTEQYNLTLHKEISKHTEVTKNREEGIKALEKEAEEREKAKRKAEEEAEALKKDEEAKKRNAKATQQNADANRTLGQTFTDVVKKVSKFYLASLPIRTFQKAITETITTVKEFDSAVTELAKVSTLSGNSMDEYTRKLGELGETVARTRTEMVESATEFKKAGFSEEDSATLAQLSALYQNTADEELSASEATSVLVSQMKAFNYTAQDAIHITDAINQVSQDFAVSSGDIGKGLTQAGASLQTYGNSFDQTIGLLTAGTEIFQGKSQQVARGLNQIANRVAKNEEVLHRYGVEIKDENEELRSTYDILSDLKPKWDKMSSAQKVALGTTLAGTNQYKIFSAVMSNFQTAIDATEKAFDSENATMRQNKVYMESLEAKTQALKTAFQDLVLGKGGLQDFAKIIVDMGTGILKLVNNLGGLPTILSAIIGALITINANLIWDKMIVGVSSTVKLLKGLASAFTMAQTKGMGLNAVIQTMGLSLSALQLVVGAVTTAITVGVMAYQKYVQQQEEASRARKEEVSKNKEVIDSYQSVIEKLSDENTSRSELNDIIDAHLSKYASELKAIENDNDARQETINKLQEEIKLRAQATKQTGYTDYNEAIQRTENTNDNEFSIYGDSKEVKDIIKKYQGTVVGSSFSWDGFTSDIFGKSGEALYDYKFKGTQEEYIKFLQSTIDELQKLDDGTNKYKNTLEGLETELENARQQQQEDADTINSYEGALYILGELDEEKAKAYEANEAEEKHNEGLKELQETYRITASDIEDYKEAHEGATDEEAIEAIAEERSQLKEVSDVIDEVRQKYDSFRSSLSAIESSQDKLKNAFKELNKEGEISFQTQMDLIDSGYATALMWDETTGKCYLNKDAVVELTKAKYQDAIADSELQMSEIQEKMKKDGIVAVESADGFLELAKAKTLAGLGLNESGYDDNGIKYSEEYIQSISNAANEVINTYNELFSSHKALTESLNNLETKGVDAYNAIEGGANSAKSATNSLTSAIDKQVSALKKVKEQAIKAVEKQISDLKKEKDQAIKAIEAQIKALEREKEIRKKYWEEQLKNLERENEEREKGLELQKKQEELARAQQNRKMIFKDGQFQYGADETEVSSAQQALFEQEDQNEYEKQKQLLEDLRDAEMEMYEQRIQTLEDYKEQVEEYYDQQIEALEEYKEQLEEEYDAQIEALELLKENITEIYDNLTEEEKAQLEALLNSETWFQDNSVSQWNSYFSRVQDAIKSGQNAVKGLLNGGIDGTGGYLVSTGANAISTGANYIGAYASGKGSIGDNQLAVVGENPRYREIVIGSKLNNDQGILMNLKRGSGVVNAGATNTLASLFHQLGGNKQLNANNVSNGGTTISINNITLPEVKNGSDFVEYLQNFALDMTQKAYAR